MGSIYKSIFIYALPLHTMQEAASNPFLEKKASTFEKREISCQLSTKKGNINVAFFIVF